MAGAVAVFHNGEKRGTISFVKGMGLVLDPADDMILQSIVKTPLPVLVKGEVKEISPTETPELFLICLPHNYWASYTSIEPID